MFYGSLVLFKMGWLGAYFSDNILEYAIGVNGQLTAVATPTLAMGIPTGKIGFDPTSQFAYVLSSIDIYQYMIGVNGVLSPLSLSSGAGTPRTPVPTIPVAPSNSTSQAWALHPNGKYIYTVSTGSSNNTVLTGWNIISVGTIASQTGGSIFSNNSISGNVKSITIDPTGQRIYFTGTNYVSGKGVLWASTINSDGTLGAISTIQLPSNISTASTVVDPTGAYVYITGFQPSVIYEYSATGPFGALSLASTASLPSGGNPVMLSALEGQDTQGIAITPTSKYAYVLYRQQGTGVGVILEYSIGSGGILSPLSTASIATTSNPKSIATDPTGNYVYVGDATGNISGYAISANSGVLSSLGAPISASTTELTHISVR